MRRQTPLWKIEEHGPADYEVFSPGNRRVRDYASVEEALRYVRRYRQPHERVVHVLPDGSYDTLIKESRA